MILVFLTLLPIFGQRWLPPELLRILSMQIGLNFIDILNRVAAIGVVFTALVLLKGHVNKASTLYLWISSAWKISWLFVILLMLGLGYPETFGLAILGGKTGPAENVVVFDFRLFAVLITVITVMMVARSIMQFQEAKLKTPPLNQETPSNSTVHTEVSIT